MLAAALVVAVGPQLHGSAYADELVLPKVLERTGTVDATYRFDRPVTGRGFLDVEWTDVDGRLVERHHIPLDLAAASKIAFPLDLRRAVTVKNQLVARLALDTTGNAGEDAHLRHQEDLSFIVPPPEGAWSDYQILMWQQQTSAGYAALKRLGVTGGMVESDHLATPGRHVTEQIETMLDYDLRWYVENIATDFYSPYHRWSKGRPPNWRFLEIKRRYWANPGTIEVFERQPSLSDAEWLGKIRNRLAANVRALERYRPLFYNLADEPGIADLSASWDFDLSPASLAAMHDWLKTRYGGLTELNGEWDSTFRSWSEIIPITTDEAIRQPGQNFAAWGDFKEWMDVAFARAVASGAAGVHAADPHALAAIEGAQIPGWGGYDYSRLAKSVDMMELYDFGDNVELVRSFNPSSVMLTTSFRSGPAEAHRVWRELLRGTRGLILWDESHEFVDQNGTVGERGRELAPCFREIRNGLGALLINGKRHLDPIAILYSPASWRLQWLLDRRSDNQPWKRRSASSEYGNDAVRTSTWNFLRAIEHMGLQPRFVAAEQVEQGELTKGRFRALILPRTIALSSRAARAIRAFVRDGGIAIADGEPGLFDQHGRRRAKSGLADLFQGTPRGSTPGEGVANGRAVYFHAPNGRDRDAVRRLSSILATSGVRPLFPMTREDGHPVDDVESYVFNNGGVTILALLHEPATYSVTSYREPDSSLTTAREPVVVDLPHPSELYDIRKKRALGRRSQVAVELGPVAPVILALSEARLREPLISGPSSARRGGNAIFHISLSGGSPAAFDVIHFTVTTPDEKVLSYHSSNLFVGQGTVSKLLPLADNDQTGVWRIHAKDALTGATATARLTVEP